MNEYNTLIIDKMIKYLNSIIKGVELRDNQERSIELIQYDKIIQDNINIGELLQNKSTAYITLKLQFKVSDSDGNELLIRDRELYIPKIINNIFIIEGSPRIPIQRLDNDFRVRIYKDAIVINNNLRVSYTNESGKIDFEVTCYNEGEELTFNESELIKIYNGRINPPEIQLITFSEVEKLKLQLKLNRPADRVPNYLTADLIRDLVQLGPDTLNDSIVDKTVLTVDKDLINYLNSNKLKWDIIRKISNKFFQYEDIYLTDIQNAINYYFNTASESALDIVSSTLNPLIYESTKGKIKIPDTVAFNLSLSEIIDPVNTPENNNTNILNELNVCASVVDGVIYITCYQLDGSKITLPYLEYLNKPVLRNTDYDYSKNKVKKLSEYTYKLRLNTHKTKNYKLIDGLIVEPKPDEMLSVSTRRIPLVNASDSVRIGMACSMMKQAIEVEANEVPLVESGHSEDIDNSSLIIKNKGNKSEVIKVTKDKIFLKEFDTDLITYVNINQPIIGQTDAITSFNPVVKVGDIVEHDQTLVTPSITRKGNFNLGLNARCFFMSYLGWSHEDGIIISESFANKLTNYSIIELSLSVQSKDSVTYIKPLGSKIQSGDNLIVSESPFKGSDKTNQLYNDKYGLAKNIEFNRSQRNLKVPNNFDEGYVISVLIQKNNNFSTDEKDLNPYQRVTLDTIDKFTKGKVSDDWYNIPDKYKNALIDPKAMSDKDNYVITFKLIKVRRAIIGSKLCNRYGSKGEVSLILPDYLMPRLDSDGNGNGEAAEVILNPAAVISRKNPSQLYEALLTKLIINIFSKVKTLCKDGKINEAKKITKDLYDDTYTKLSDTEFSKLVEGGVENFKVSMGCYSEINFDKINSLCKKYGVEETQYIYCPDIVISEEDSGLKAYSPDEVNINNLKNPKVYELGFVEAPVITGSIYMMKLFHSADYVGKVTPDLILSEGPYMKRGLYRSIGQKIGEMELWALLSSGSESFVVNNNKNQLSNQYEFLNELLLAGYTLVDQSGIPISSPYRNKIHKLKLNKMGRKS